ncbi:UNVERIFIED_CONTAM: hypothetical protein Sindi_0506800 [Sesamum indicum]
MLDISSKLPKHVIMMSPDEDGGESPCKIDIEYEWLPLKCTSCMTLGHSAKECGLKKVVHSTKLSVTVYVPKLGPARDGCEKGTNQSACSEQVENRDILTKETGPSRVDKAVRDLVAEFRLQLFGLIESRVQLNNIARIQSFLMPQWKWFVDYATVGNRIWRDLWGILEALALNYVDIPWMVGGDFNAVRDLSEVCGTLGDIRMAMEDFNSCIQNSGLLPLPMQGECFTWHNYSASPRNLCKRLDRILMNDF